MNVTKKLSAHPDDIRRAHNLNIGMRLIEAGIPVFVSRDKQSLIHRWQRLDTDLSEADREAVRQQQKTKGAIMPTVIGSTLTPRTWERMQRIANREGTASICCGLAKIVVIDADNKERDGPALLADFLEQNGGAPSGTLILTSQSGAKHYVFADREGKYRNVEGEIGRKLGCNVRGVAGQIVAPGSWRADGKRYGTLDDLQRFIDAIVMGTLPELPQCLADLIGEQSAGSINDSDPRVKACIAELKDDEWPDYETTFGPGARLDLERMKSGSDKFQQMMNNPREDRSSNRLSLASALKGASSRASVRDFAAFCGEYPDIFGDLVDKNEGSGTYDLRNLSRDWTKATPAHVSLSNGEAFGAVAEDEPSPRADGDRSGNTPAPKEPPGWLKNVTSIPSALDINALPPRAYLYGTYLQRGQVTLLSAAGGVGKSAWALSVGIDLACGIDHLDAGEFKPRKTLIYDGEDDTTEMLRRAGAYYTHHNFTAEMRENVEKNLTVLSGVESPLRFAEYRDGRVLIVERSLKALDALITEHGIEVVMLNPLIGLHSIPENDNAAMNVLVTELKKMAATKQVGVLVAHHDKKNIGARGIEDVGQDDTRGAGTITTPMRVMLTLRRLTNRDAQRLGIPSEDVPRIVALSKGAKSNYSARDVGAKLFFAHSVQAENGSEDFGADSTVALAPYKHERREAGLGDDATERVLAELDGDDLVGSDPRHSNWLGLLIAQERQWDASNKKVRETVKSIIADWMERGWIAEATFEASGKGADRRKAVKVYKRGASRPTPRVYEFDAVDDEGDDA